MERENNNDQELDLESDRPPPKLSCCHFLGCMTHGKVTHPLWALVCLLLHWEHHNSYLKGLLWESKSQDISNTAQHLAESNRSVNGRGGWTLSTITIMGETGQELPAGRREPPVLSAHSSSLGILSVPRCPTGCFLLFSLVLLLLSKTLNVGAPHGLLRLLCPHSQCDSIFLMASNMSTLWPFHTYIPNPRPSSWASDTHLQLLRQYPFWVVSWRLVVSQSQMELLTCSLTCSPHSLASLVSSISINVIILIIHSTARTRSLQQV